MTRTNRDRDYFMPTAFPSRLLMLPEFASLSQQAKLAFLYLIASPFGSPCGLYHASVNQLGHLSGMGIEAFLDGMHECRDCGFLAWDEDAGLVRIRNVFRWNRPSNPNMLKSWLRHWGELPSSPVKREHREVLLDAARGWGDGFLRVAEQMTREPEGGEGSENDGDLGYTVSRRAGADDTPREDNVVPIPKTGGARAGAEPVEKSGDAHRDVGVTHIEPREPTAEAGGGTFNLVAPDDPKAPGNKGEKGSPTPPSSKGKGKGKGKKKNPETTVADLPVAKEWYADLWAMFVDRRNGMGRPLTHLGATRIQNEIERYIEKPGCTTEGARNGIIRAIDGNWLGVWPDASRDEPQSVPPEAPEWLDTDLWRRYCESRAHMGSPLDESSGSEILSTLTNWKTRYQIPVNAIENAVRDAISYGYKRIPNPIERNGGGLPVWNEAGPSESQEPRKREITPEEEAEADRKIREIEKRRAKRAAARRAANGRPSGSAPVSDPSPKLTLGRARHGAATTT